MAATRPTSGRAAASASNTTRVIGTTTGSRLTSVAATSIKTGIVVALIAASGRIPHRLPNTRPLPAVLVPLCNSGIVMLSENEAVQSVDIPIERFGKRRQ